MNTQRDLLIRQAFDVSKELSLSNPVYAQQISNLFSSLLKSDLQKRDITICPRSFYRHQVEAIIKAKSSAILAGKEELLYLLQNSGLSLTFYFEDGERIPKGEVLAKITGQAQKILSYERTILNFLQRLSGIATLTKSFCELIPNSHTYIASTRKTFWGWLDKKAVTLGGGLTHRLGLFDAAMIKDNHLAVLKSVAPDALKKAIERLASKNIRFIEVEVKNADEFWEIVNIYYNLPSKPVKCIMFDHFQPKEIQEIITELKKRGVYDSILLEASGNITKDTIAAYANTGVDIISMGIITHSAPSADFSLLIEKI